MCGRDTRTDLFTGRKRSLDHGSGTTNDRKLLGHVTHRVQNITIFLLINKQYFDRDKPTLSIK